MTEIVRDWLPETAFTSDHMAAALGPTVAAWAERWLTDPSCVALVADTENPHRPLASAGRDVPPAQTRCVTLSGPGRRLFLEAAMQVNLGEAPPNAQDHRLLDAFLTMGLDDLCGMIRQAAGISDSPGDSGAPVATLALYIDSQRAGEFCVPRHDLVAMIRKAAPRKQLAPLPAASRKAAVGACALRVEGVLGSVTLTMDELKDMAPGDVLVLDTPLDSGITLRRAGDDTPLAQGQLGQSVGRRGFVLQH